jgi:hypothetical protein
MFTIMWNPLGSHVLDKLPDGVTMNSNYFTENTFGPLEEKYSRMKGQRMEGDLSCVWTTLPFTIVGWQQISLQVTISCDSTTRHTRGISLRATFTYFR